jgi:hypothetical protein
MTGRLDIIGHPEKSETNGERTRRVEVSSPLGPVDPNLFVKLRRALYLLHQSKRETSRETIERDAITGNTDLNLAIS